MSPRNIGDADAYSAMYNYVLVSLCRFVGENLIVIKIKTKWRSLFAICSILDHLQKTHLTHTVVGVNSVKYWLIYTRVPQVYTNLPVSRDCGYDNGGGGGGGSGSGLVGILSRERIRLHQEEDHLKWVRPLHQSTVLVNTGRYCESETMKILQAVHFR